MQSFPQFTVVDSRLQAGRGEEFSASRQVNNCLLLFGISEQPNGVYAWRPMHPDDCVLSFCAATFCFQSHCMCRKSNSSLSKLQLHMMMLNPGIYQLGIVLKTAWIQKGLPWPQPTLLFLRTTGGSRCYKKWAGRAQALAEMKMVCSPAMSYCQPQADSCHVQIWAVFDLTTTVWLEPKATSSLESAAVQCLLNWIYN